MLSRLLVSVGFVCGLASGAEAPWARFFNQPAVSAAQGMRQAMSNAFASAFDPLSLKARKDPTFPILKKPVEAAKLAAPMACSVPLLEYKVPQDKEFFIRKVHPHEGPADSGIVKPVTPKACN